MRRERKYEMHNEVKLAKKKLSKKEKKLYITKYTYVCIVLAISYTKTKPKNDQLTLVKPKNISYSQH